MRLPGSRRAALDLAYTPDFCDTRHRQTRAPALARRVPDGRAALRLGARRQAGRRGLLGDVGRGLRAAVLRRPQRAARARRAARSRSATTSPARSSTRLLQEHYFLPPLDLNDAELAALSTAVHLLDGQFAYAEPLRLALQNLALGPPEPVVRRRAGGDRAAARQRLHGRGRRAAAEARDGDLEAAHRRLPLLGDLLRRGGDAHGRSLQPVPAWAATGT